MTLTIFALRQSAQPPRLEMPTPQRSDRVSLMQPKPSHPAPSPMTLGSRQNHASPAHNKPCQKWTLTEASKLPTASGKASYGARFTRSSRLDLAFPCGVSADEHSAPTALGSSR